MLSFLNDYSEGAAQPVLDALVRTNFDQTCGYGLDPHCENARALIRSAVGSESANVHFLVGGTQVNTTLIAAALRPHQGAVAAETGHIACHESGAIESTGHKVITLPTDDGKITADQIDALCAAHYADPTAEHQVQPGLVYISLPTETGMLYSREELRRISEVCRKYRMYLYVDGARLGCALTAEGNDVTLPDLAAYADAFTIGGTKNGILFGEALIITDEALNRDFRYILKQRGGMLAKGRLLGIQFEALFTDDLYFALARHANAEAKRIREALSRHGVPFLAVNPTNQTFPILNRTIANALAKEVAFEEWKQIDADTVAVRFCTSWATKPEDVTALIALFDQLL